MTRYRVRTLVLMCLMASLLCVALVFEYLENATVKVEHLNVVINDINQQILYDEQALTHLVGKLALINNVDIALLKRDGNLAVDTGTLPQISVPYGLSTLRGVEFYVVPVEPHNQRYERIVIYGRAPALHALSSSTFNPSEMILVGLIVLALILQLIFIRRYGAFKDALKMLMPREERPLLETLNLHGVHRFLLSKVGEYQKEIHNQAYSHSVEHTKQDERMRNMMHDMKTPIAALHAFVEAYEDGMYIGPRLEQKMPLVVRNVNHLLQLTHQYDDFLKYSSWQSKINMRKISMEVLVQDVLMGVERDFSMIGRTIQMVVMEYPCSLVCDLTEIKKLLHILVENAHKYSEQDKPIVLSAMVRSQMLYLAIKDYGIGIAQDQHQAVFEPFVKVDRARGASAQSYGIGLYIAKQIAHRHGGYVTLESSIGRGALFTVLLPVIED